jgi:hypothetical protein
MAAFLFMRLVNTILCLLLGLLFIASGLLKLFPIEPFEYNFVRLGMANWLTAPMISRSLIGLELGLGLFLSLQFYLNRFTLRATLFLLIFFSIYLVYQLLTEGNSGNCGCFGTFLEMTPLESLIKNMMMIGAVVWLIITKQEPFLRLEENKIIKRVVLLGCISASLILPYALNIPEFISQNQFDKNQINYPLDLTQLYNSPDAPATDVRRGKHIFSLMSLRCEHCKTAAFKMAIIFKRHPEMPFYNLYKGNAEKNLATFFAFTHAEAIPYSMYNTQDFITLSGGELPAIYWLEDGNVVRTSGYIDLEEQEIINWLNEP